MGDMLEKDGIRGDAWTRAYPLTEQQLAELRAKAIQYGEEEAHFSPEVFTCDGCTRAPICKCVFDLYNTDGDCIWEK